jgi:hypothetical protein
MARGNRVKLPDTVPQVPAETWEAFNWLWMFCRWLNDEEVKVPWEAEITLDANVSRSFHITLEGNTTINKPRNLYPGQTLNIVLQQDIVGSRLITWGDGWTFGDIGEPVLSTVAETADFLSSYYNGQTDKMFVIFWQGTI